MSSRILWRQLIAVPAKWSEVDLEPCQQRDYTDQQVPVRSRAFPTPSIGVAHRQLLSVLLLTYVYVEHASVCVYSFLTTGSLSKFLFAQPMQSQGGKQPILFCAHIFCNSRQSKYLYRTIWWPAFQPAEQTASRWMHKMDSYIVNMNDYLNIWLTVISNNMFAFWGCEPFERSSCLPSQVLMLRKIQVWHSIRSHEALHVNVMLWLMALITVNWQVMRWDELLAQPND